jgi:hypothetical protein
MNTGAVVGWLMWNTLRLLAGLGLLILAGGVVMLIWFMFDAGLAWVAIVVLAGAVGLLATFVRRALSGSGAATNTASQGIIE